MKELKANEVEQLLQALDQMDSGDLYAMACTCMRKICRRWKLRSYTLCHKDGAGFEMMKFCSFNADRETFFAVAMQALREEERRIAE